MEIVQNLAVAVVTTECARYSLLAALATVMLDGKVQTVNVLQVSPYCTLNILVIYRDHALYTI